MTQTIQDFRVSTLAHLLDTEFPPRVVLLEPWLKESTLTMLYAPTGVGKSWATLSIALCVAGGGSYLGWRCEEPQKVLFVDGEMDEDELQERSQGVLKGLDVDVAEARENLTFFSRSQQSWKKRFVDLGEPEDQNSVINMAQKLGVRLLVLDNFSTLCTVADENKGEAFDGILEFLMRCRQAGLSAILVHHSKKASEGSGAYRGSSKLGLVFNNIIKLEKPKESVGLPQGVAFEMNFEKCRGKPFEGMTSQIVTMRETEGGLLWEHGPAESQQLRDLVAAVRSCKFSTGAALAEHFGVAPGTISKWKGKATATRVQGMDEKEWERCLEAAEDDEDDEGSDF